MLAGGLLIMIFEMKVQPNLSYLDFLLWSAGIVTTIGYGGYTAETTLGKLIVLMLMLVGTLFIWSYMAFLVTALFAPELSSLEKDFHDVEKEVRDLRVAADNEKLEGAKKEKITHSLFE